MPVRIADVFVPERQKMKDLGLLPRLVYTDIAYLADLFEVITGDSPKTLISKNQGGKAGTSIPFFSAEVNAQETRSFSVSSIQMLDKLFPHLEQVPELDSESFVPGMPSQYGWVTGELTVFKMRSVNSTPEGGVQTEALFHIRPKPGIDFALITTPEYFFSGMGTFVKLQDTLLMEMSIKVRAYLRVTTARSHVGQWIAIPLLILEA